MLFRSVLVATIVAAAASMDLPTSLNLSEGISGFAGGAGALAAGYGSMKTYLTNRQGKFSAMPVVDKKMDKRQEMLRKAEFDGEEIGEYVHYMGNEFAGRKQIWDMDIPPFAYKLVPYALDVIQHMTELEAKKVKMLENVKRDNTEGVRIEDFYSRLQIAAFHGLIDKYYAAAKREAKKTRPESILKAENLINTHDTLHAVLNEYIGTSTWMDAEVVDPAKNIFSLSRFRFDLEKCEVLKDIMQAKSRQEEPQTIDTDKRSGYIRSESKNEHSLVFQSDKIDFDFLKKQEIITNAAADLDRRKQRVQKGWREIMRKLDKYDDRKIDYSMEAEQTLKSKLKRLPTTIKNAVVDNALVQQKLANNLVDLLIDNGFIGQAEIVKFATLSASSITYNISAPWVDPIERYREPEKHFYQNSVDASVQKENN